MKCKKDLIGHICDNVMWYVVYLLPLFLMLLSWFHGSFISLSDTFQDAGLSFFTDNPILTVLVSLFGSEGTFPIFTDTSLLVYFSYFVSVLLIHLVIDILLYIPRMCHFFVNHGWGGASHE